ncbi:radical SAM protein [Ruminococcaceae bacterium OttesenSCG-928-I18]|nr:radical SAM protein [Ruminococcaceae bacterium OttesenSCG-928-I18]
MAREECMLCPRGCGVDRRFERGWCGAGPLPRVSLAAPHHDEEPVLSGTRGSGTVFFTGCALRCRFCQNHRISTAPDAGQAYDEARLAALFLRLQAQGVHNLNLVTAGHYRPAVLSALRAARRGGLRLPVVWNTGGYECKEAVHALAEDIQIHLADLKFRSQELSGALAGAPDYFSFAGAYLREACRVCGPPQMDAQGLLRRGVIVRLLVLPGQRQDAIALLRWAAQALPKDGFLLSLMSQYTPPAGLSLAAPFNRRVSRFELRRVQEEALALGFTQGWFQSRESATEGYLPDFSLS